MGRYIMKINSYFTKHIFLILKKMINFGKIDLKFKINKVS